MPVKSSKNFGVPPAEKAKAIDAEVIPEVEAIAAAPVVETSEPSAPVINDEGFIVQHPEGVKVICMVKNVWTSKGKLFFRQKALIHKDDADLLEKTEQVMKL